MHPKYVKRINLEFCQKSLSLISCTISSAQYAEFIYVQFVYLVFLHYLQYLFNPDDVLYTNLL